MRKSKLMLALAACTAGALVSATAIADEVKVVPKSGTALNDMKVTRDKDTGRIRAATPEEIQAMGRGTSAAAPSIVVLSRPTTTILTRADGSGVIRRSVDDMDSVTVTRTADGKFVLGHGEKHAPAAPKQSMPKE